jgi:hypothetical protein
MALTASRSELNVALVGESEVSAMLEATKKQMAELEAKIRQLTGASKDQTEAAKTAAAATVGVNDRMKGYAKNAEGVVEGIDKIKGATEKIIGVFGFLGMAVSAAIDVYKFFTEQSEKAKEAQKKFTEELKKAEAQAETTRDAVEKLAEAERAAAAVNRTVGVQMAEDRLKLIKLAGDKAAEERAQAELEHQKELARVEELKVKQEELAEQRLKLVLEEREANSQVRMATQAMLALKKDQEAAEKEIARIKSETSRNEQGSEELLVYYAEQKKKLEADVKRIKHDISVLTTQTLGPERERAEQAAKTRVELDKQKGALSGLLGLATQVADAMGAALSFVGPKKKEPEKKDTPKGGGGKSKAEREREAAEKAEAEALRDAERMVAAQAGITKLAEREDQVRQAVADEAKLFEGLARKRSEVVATLDSIPKDLAGGAEKAFAPLSDALKKQLEEIDKVLGSRVEFDLEIASPEEEDALLKALGTQKTAYDKLTESIGANIAMQSKAQDASVELLEAYERGLPTKRLEEFQTGLAQLQQMSVPAFGEIGNVIGQVSDQFAKYKAGQTSMTNATIQGASAIAGAIAKQVGGVKAEAGIRALFETAMGFATLANPVESAGHFTAAAMFGLAAGGVLKTGASSGAGGQQAPATRAASTTASSNTGGGGPITNVYNLQTGIVDGQSTARAFRQAEQQARNTGMASAGGW